MPTPPATSTDKKPLVFISAARKNSAWRGRLTEKLDRYANQIEWWDISKIQTGQGDYQTDQIDTAIDRANVAVILLSTAYIDSGPARAELEALEKWVPRVARYSF